MFFNGFKNVILAAVLTVFLAFSIVAEDAPKEFKYSMGLRLGGWSNQGDLPVNLVYNPADSNDFVMTDVKDGSFYLEGFFGIWLQRNIELEFSLGITNRGDVTITENGLSDFGQLLIYPILLQAKLYPLASSSSKFQPFVGGGGGLYYGRRNIQITQNYYFTLAQIEGETETDFNIVAVGGFDYKLSPTLALDFTTKYMPIKFGDLLVGEDDYSAITFTVGIKYFRN
jgi:outer membrane protein W